MRYVVDNVKNYSQSNGWLCGQFFPTDSVLRNSDLEVKYWTLQVGEKHPEHIHPIGTELTIIIAGHMKWMLDGVVHELKDGDFVFELSNVKEEILEVLKPTTFITVRTPSVPDNKQITK